MPTPYEHINYTERIRAFLTARPGEWLSSDVLALVGGKCGWRTRISDARLELQAAGLGTIENKLTRPRNDDGEVIAVRSWYRFVPAQTAQDAPEGFTPPADIPVYTTAPAMPPARPSRTTTDLTMGRLF